MFFNLSFVVSVLVINFDISKCLSFCQDDICLNWNDGALVPSLKDAQNICTNNGSKLLEILDDRMFDALKSFSGMITSDNIWLNLQKVTHEWRWLDGTPSQEIQQNNQNSAIVELSGSNVSVSSRDANSKFLYACQKQNLTCDATCSVEINSESVNWFEARNECLKNGKDLLVMKNIQTDAKQIFENHQGKPYWLGLTSMTYFWQTANLPLKKSSWLGDSPYPNDICAFLSRTNHLKWVSSDCNVQHLNLSYAVVCYTDERTTTQAPQHLPTNPTLSSLPLSPSPSSSSSSSLSREAQIGIGVGVSLFGLLLLVAVVVVVAVAHARKSEKNKKLLDNQSLGNQSAKTSAYMRHDSTTSSTPASTLTPPKTSTTTTTTTTTTKPPLPTSTTTTTTTTKFPPTTTTTATDLGPQYAEVIKMAASSGHKKGSKELKSNDHVGDKNVLNYVEIDFIKALVHKNDDEEEEKYKSSDDPIYKNINHVDVTLNRKSVDNMFEVDGVDEEFEFRGS